MIQKFRESSYSKLDFQDREKLKTRGQKANLSTSCKHKRWVITENLFNPFPKNILKLWREKPLAPTPI